MQSPALGRLCLYTLRRAQRLGLSCPDLLLTGASLPADLSTSTHREGAVESGFPLKLKLALPVTTDPVPNAQQLSSLPSWKFSWLCRPAAEQRGSRGGLPRRAVSSAGLSRGGCRQMELELNLLLQCYQCFFLFFSTP